MSPPYETSLSTPPDPTFTVLASLEFQSEGTGGSSGRGRLDWRSAMISDLGLEFWSIMDCEGFYMGECFVSVLFQGVDLLRWGVAGKGKGKRKRKGRRVPTFV